MTGHAASIVSMVRSGALFDNQAIFADAATLTTGRNLVVLGELDDICDAAEMRELGFGDVRVVKGTGHDLVREKVADVAGPICELLGKVALV